MKYQLVFQDPSSDAPAYLYESIMRQLEADEVARFEGVFAFASKQGVASLLEDPDFEQFLGRGGTCSLVGVGGRASDEGGTVKASDWLGSILVGGTLAIIFLLGVILGKML